MKLLHILSLIPASFSWSLAQDVPPAKPESVPVTRLAAAPVKPSIIRLDDARCQVGEIILNRMNREIRFPAKVNMNEGLIEYAVTLQKGYVHEAILITNSLPTHLNLAFALLRYTPSPELYSEMDDTGHPTGVYPEVSLPVRASARVAVEAEWIADGILHRIPLNEWFQSNVTKKMMEPGPWLYGGSTFSEGAYTPDLSGNLISGKSDDRGAMLIYPGADSPGDRSWSPSPKLVPAVGTAVTVIISPFFKRKSLPTP
jgi:hypothetical protein